MQRYTSTALGASSYPIITFIIGHHGITLPHVCLIISTLRNDHQRQWGLERGMMAAKARFGNILIDLIVIYSKQSWRWKRTRHVSVRAKYQKGWPWSSWVLRKKDIDAKNLDQSRAVARVSSLFFSIPFTTASPLHK